MSSDSIHTKMADLRQSAIKSVSTFTRANDQSDVTAEDVRIQLTKWKNALQKTSLKLQSDCNKKSDQNSELREEFDLLDEQYALFRKALLLNAAKKENENYYRLMSTTADSILRQTTAGKSSSQAEEITSSLQKVNKLLTENVQLSNETLQCLVSSSEHLMSSSDVNSAITTNVLSSKHLVKRYSNKQTIENLILLFALCIFVLTILFILKVRILKL
ncbi:hypothetical protein GJ496_010255 [Pomphorhynchus laevis]|nr:hypothetical protein GJ496_010255 [Pomphorhynchus laevis]